MPIFVAEHDALRRPGADSIHDDRGKCIRQTTECFVFAMDRTVVEYGERRNLEPALSEASMTDSGLHRVVVNLGATHECARLIAPAVLENLIHSRHQAW